MKMIGESATEKLVFPGSERGGDGAGVTRILDGVQPIDSGRKKGARFGGRDFEIGDEEDEVQLGGNRKQLVFEAANDIEATEAGRRRIVRMAF